MITSIFRQEDIYHFGVILDVVFLDEKGTFCGDALLLSNCSGEFGTNALKWTFEISYDVMGVCDDLLTSIVKNCLSVMLWFQVGSDERLSSKFLSTALTSVLNDWRAASFVTWIVTNFV